MDTSPKDNSACSICATEKFFATVSISGLMKILCTVISVWVACSIGDKGSKGVLSSG